MRGTKKKLLYNKIYIPEELDALFDNYYLLFVRNYDDSRIPPFMRELTALSKDRNTAILSVLLYQGIFASEIKKIETDDLDLRKATIKIRGGDKKLNQRILPLAPSQMGVLMHYLQNTRPKLLEYRTAESKKLFLPFPVTGKNKTDSETIDRPCNTLNPAIKSIDKQFVDFKQVRTSLITHWIKTYGLRKAQYLAGHRSILATQAYVCNDLENLTCDINKLHPFGN